MDVTCQSCRATYKVDDSKIPPNGIKAKCPKCGHSFLLKKPDDDIIAVGGDAEPPPEAAPAPAPDPFAGFGAPPVPDLGGMGASPAPANPFATGATADPFAGGFGGAAPAPASDPFAGGFGGGGFGSGGFDSPPPAGGAPQDIGGLFNAKTAFEIKRTNGEQIGPFDLFTIKQMIYEGQLNGTEALLDAAGNWVPITTVEDLGEIFRLTGAQAASDGGAQWGAQPEKPAGWQKMEQPSAPGKPATPPPAAPAPNVPSKTSGGRAQPAAEKPAPPVALDKGRKRGVGERAIILTEGVWSLTRSRGGRIFLGVVLLVGLIGGVGYQFRDTFLRVVGLSGKFEAATLVAEGDKTLGSGERGPMLASLTRYSEALTKHQKSVDAQARSAEIAAAFWFVDPPRLDMKTKAQQNLESAKAGGDSYAVLRAQARVALASRDIAGAEAAIATASAMPEAAADPVLAAVKGDVLLEKGDVSGAEAAYNQAKASPATAARGALGVARVKLRAGQYDAAKAAADEALKAEPDNGGAKALAAYLSTRAGGDVPAARKTLREIAESSHRFGIERSRASYYLGVLSEEKGETAPALHHMSDALRQYPGDSEATAAAKRLFQTRFPDRNVDAWIAAVSKVRGSTAMEKVQTGSIEFEKRNWQGALSPLLAAVQEDAGSARPQYELGRLLVEVSETEKAKSKGHFERAISIDAEWAEPLIALARWELDAKQVKEARTHGEKAVALDPSLPDAYRVAAAAALAEKDYAAAEASLQSAVEFDPEDYKSWLDLGEARRLGGRAQEALPAVEKAAALRPDLSEPKVRLGAAYEALGDLPKASSYYAEAAKAEPANLEIATRAGVIEARQGNYVEARKRLEAVVKAQSSNAEAQFWLGSAYQYSGEPEKALEAYRASVKADYFDKYLAYWHLGELLAGPGASRDVDAAMAQLNKCLEDKPDHFPCLEEQAKILIEQNQPDDAIKVLKKVEGAISKLPPAQKDPVTIRVIMQQAKIAKGQGKTKEAEALFRGVLKKDAKNAEVYWNLGQLIAEADTRRAKQLYQQATTANPAYAPPWRELGYIAREEGNDCVAKKNFQKFIELSPSEDEKKPVKDELAQVNCER